MAHFLIEEINESGLDAENYLIGKILKYGYDYGWFEADYAWAVKCVEVGAVESAILCLQIPGMWWSVSRRKNSVWYTGTQVTYFDVPIISIKGKPRYPYYAAVGDHRAPQKKVAYYHEANTSALALAGVFVKARTE